MKLSRVTARRLYVYSWVLLSAHAQMLNMFNVTVKLINNKNRLNKILVFFFFSLWLSHRKLTSGNVFLANNWPYIRVHIFGNSYTMGCPPVRGDNPRALASGLSYVQVDKHGITILYHLHQCRPCTS